MSKYKHFTSLDRHLKGLKFKKISLDMLPVEAIKAQIGSFLEIWESPYGIVIASEILPAHTREDIEDYWYMLQQVLDVHLSDLYRETNILKDGYIFFFKDVREDLSDSLQELIWDMEDNTSVALKQVLYTSDSSTPNWDKIKDFPFGNYEVISDLIFPTETDFSPYIGTSHFQESTSDADIFIVKGWDQESREKVFSQLSDSTRESFWEVPLGEDPDSLRNELEMVTWFDQLRSEITRYPNRKYLLTFQRNISVSLLLQKLEETEVQVRVFDVKKGIDKPRLKSYIY